MRVDNGDKIRLSRGLKLIYGDVADIEVLFFDPENIQRHQEEIAIGHSAHDFILRNLEGWLNIR